MVPWRRRKRSITRRASFTARPQDEINVINGSCCCGAIKFELINPPSMMGTCHCSRCRKVGASTLVFVKKDDFRWIQGQEFVARYEPEAPYKHSRTFCKRCGTSLGEVGSQQDSFPVSANCLDNDPLVRNTFHVFVASKPAWYEICDSAKQFQEFPPGG
ncbi:GFA family protein [Pyxidicoccus sp. 3LFB2]